MYGGVNMKALTAAATLIALTGLPASAAQRVTCTGILIDVDMVPHADFPMAVIYDDGNLADAHTCVVDLGHASQWPLRGACQQGEKCSVTGPYFRKIGNTYYMRRWDSIHEPGGTK
jgi:hypothetical protein